MPDAPGFWLRNAWLVPCFPLLGGLIAAAGGKWLKARADVPVVAGIALAFVCSLGLLGAAGPGAGSHHVVCRWVDVGSDALGLHVPVDFRVDGLTTMMLSMVTFVSTLVAVFATGYMAGEAGYPRFFAVVGLFVFSMTGLVLSNNYLLTYAFWEGVGVCSYLLVGFWHSKPAAAAAAKKAFLVNRIGDVGFAIAVFWMWTATKTHDLSYDTVLTEPFTATAAAGIALLLFWAATAKSAQLPLYVWLPDAMEGPTPVSALIHAATMVTAGVYLVARSMPLIARTPWVLTVVAVVGCLTALLAALIALTQTDLKRVMAYSTVSQLGYMFMALGAGVGGVARLAVTAAMFHLFTHAFFKALLFLASGSVMHAMGGVIDMRRFHGLSRRLPYTCWTFAAGALALSGIFPFAGFFSKDEILLALKTASHAGGNYHEGVYLAVFWVAVFTAFLTAFYTGRAFFLTFFGGPEKLPAADDPEADHLTDTADPSSHGAPTHDDHAGAHPDDHGHGSHFGHESGPVMTIPLMVLAGCALAVGLVFGPTHLLEHHLDKTYLFESLPPLAHHATDWMVPATGLAAGLLGIGLSYLFYFAPSPLPGRVASAFGPLYRASLDKFYVDEVYDAAVVSTTLAAAKVSGFFDEYVVHGLVRLTAWFPRAVGREVLGPFQNGLIQFYAAVTALGVAGLLWVLLLGY